MRSSLLLPALSSILVLATGTLFSNASNTSNATLFAPLYPAHSNSTPLFHNSSGVSANPLINVLRAQGSSNGSLIKRQSSGSNGLPEGTCAPGTPCSNGACCSNSGICGYSPDQCGSSVCISNCDAKAECGQYAVAGEQNCPLNVCCSYYGFCGTTDDFCNTDTDRPCQQGYGECGPAPTPSCSGGSSTSGRLIGYYESWSSSRACDSRRPNDLDLTGLTHVNFAFVYFDPVTFQLTPMNAGDSQLYIEFTGLKSKKPTLQTWISIGGWSFNDPTNTPNTQTAFSNMVSNTANRQAFISSLTNFMSTYGFDGVDIDWEYPGAPDRGGVEADTANFVTFLQELRSALGSRGISATVPSSYWYMRWFDVKNMQNYVDWLNFMSYDIHGTWDGTNKETGPYVRPHTNWTEIATGLDLLWRDGVDPAKVTLGLGWYGRSFTLANPSCSTPGCVFSSGGNAGECTKSAGTLSNAEINRIIAQYGLTPTFDEEAAVNWISWDSNQWVSYDNGPSIQLKLQRASGLCLGGAMIWAIDLDDSAGTSNEDTLGIGASSGYSDELTSAVQSGISRAEDAAAVENSCYWSLCGDSCTYGFFQATQANGQVGGVSDSTICSDGEMQTLCCAAGTTMGQCEWDGWAGVGLACGSRCNDLNATLVAANTNSFEQDPTRYAGEMQTCTGGYQVYCCNGFAPSPYANTNSLNLIGRSGSTSNSKRSSLGLWKRDASGDQDFGYCVGYGSIDPSVFQLEALGLLPSDYGCVQGNAELSGSSPIGTVPLGATQNGCLRSGNAYGKGCIVNPYNPYARPKPKQPKVGGPVKVSGQLGQWLRISYANNVQDCRVTYTCKYGLGWDEICDNQRWAITSALGGNIVYHRGARVGSSDKLNWSKSYRNRFYVSQAAVPDANNIYRCQVEEFPMGVLVESLLPNVQVVRFVDGGQNGRQGIDFQQWLSAQWEPCSTLRRRNAKGPPPITWEIGPIPAGDPRLDGETTGAHFLQAWGFSYPGQATTCFATYTTDGGGQQTIVSDNGFQGLPNDPMFQFKQWPAQDYWNTLTQQRGLGGPLNPMPNYATDVASANFVKRQMVKSVLEGKLMTTRLSAEDLETATVIMDEDGSGSGYALLLEKWEDPVKPRPVAAMQVTATPGESPNGQKAMSPVRGSVQSQTKPVETGASS